MALGSGTNEFYGRGAGGHTVHVNNQPKIILLVPLSKGELFLEWWWWGGSLPIWRRGTNPTFLCLTCFSCSPFGSKVSPKFFLQLVS